MPERGLRQRIRHAIHTAYPSALVLALPGNAWTGPGLPDLMVWLPPLLFGLEVKVPGGKATRLQKSRLASLARHKVITAIVHSPTEAVVFISEKWGRLQMAFDDDILAGLDAALGEVAEANADLPEEDRLRDGEAVFAIGDTTVTLPTTTQEDTSDIPLTPEIEQMMVEEAEAQAEAEPDDADLLALLNRNNAIMNDLRAAVEGLAIEISLLRSAIGDDADAEAEPIQTVDAPAPRRRGRPRKVS